MVRAGEPQDGVRGAQDPSRRGWANRALRGHVTQPAHFTAGKTEAGGKGLTCPGVRRVGPARLLGPRDRPPCWPCSPAPPPSPSLSGTPQPGGCARQEPPVLSLTAGDQRSGGVTEASSLLGGSPRRPCGRKGSPYHTGQLHPAVRVADLLQHINQMKTAEGYGFKQEYEVQGPRPAGPPRQGFAWLPLTVDPDPGQPSA